MSVLYPCGPDVRLSPGLIRVGPDTIAEMGRWLRAQGQRGLIQVHTHPEDWTDHSDTDNDFPIASSEDFVSVVWPHYGRDNIVAARDLGVHRLAHGAWKTLSHREADALIRVVESEVLVWAVPEGGV